MKPPIAQTVNDLTKTMDQFGVMVTVLIVVLLAFLVGVWYIITKSQPKQVEQMREDHSKVVSILREDAKEDRDQFTALMHLQRTEFLSYMAERDKRLAEMLAERDRRFAEMLAEQVRVMVAAIARIEQGCEKATNEAIKKLEQLMMYTRKVE